MTKSDILEKMRTNTDWYNKSYAAYLIGIYEQGRGIAYGASRSPYAMSYGINFQNYTRLDHFDWFWDNAELTKHRDDLLEAAQQDPQFSENFLHEYNNTYRAFTERYNQLATQPADLDDLRQLHEYFRELHHLMLEQGARGYIVDSFLTSDGDWLVDLIRNELGDQATHDIIATFTQPTFSTFVNDAHTSILQIAQAMQTHASPTIIEGQILEHIDQFFWIKATYKDYVRLAASDVRKLAQVELDKHGADIQTLLQDEAGRTNRNVARKQELYTKLGISKALQRVLRISEIFTHIQDKRKECVLRLNLYLLETLASLASRYHIEPETMFYLTMEEFLDLLTNKQPNWSLIKRRRTNGCLVLLGDDRADILMRNEYTPFEIKNFFPENDGLKTLTGMVAFAGLVTGKVQILRTTADIANFEEGNILVANQTTPEFVPAMRKAAAIITDQGGITCHAAIVARELHKPCIIGTKVATQVLQNDTLVEVNATTGTVRIIQ